MTLALALATAPLGRVVSTRCGLEFQALAMRNLRARQHPAGVVEFKCATSRRGSTRPAQIAFFLDVSEPWNYARRLRPSFRGRGAFRHTGSTMNQVIPNLAGVEGRAVRLLEVEELLLRPL